MLDVRHERSHANGCEPLAWRVVVVSSAYSSLEVLFQTLDNHPRDDVSVRVNDLPGNVSDSARTEVAASVRFVVTIHLSMMVLRAAHGAFSLDVVDV